MGEIADMTLEGQMCQWCGEILGDGDGFPVVCSGCQREHGVDQFGNKPGEESQPVNAKSPKTVACPELTCKRKFRTREAAAQHWIAKHEEEDNGNKEKESNKESSEEDCQERTGEEEGSAQA